MNLFIAGVGNVELFKGDQSVLVSKTLVDSSINLSVSLEDVRAGEGAKLYGRYAHSSGMTMKLTDAMFRLEFLAANIGADVLAGGSAVGTATKTVEASGVVKVNDLSILPLYEGSKEGRIVWYSTPGSDVWTKVPLGDGNQFSVGSAIAEGDKVCVRYIQNNDAGEHIVVKANFIPDTLTAVLTAPLFAGGENIANSTKVGTLTITIPRFMLNGTTDLSMSMTGQSQTNLEGSALAVDSGDCDNEGYYAIISKVITNASITDGMQRIEVINPDTREEALSSPIYVYGFYQGVGAPKLLPFSAYSITGTGVTYNSTTGYITINDTGDVECTVTVTGPVSSFTDTFEVPAAE